MWECIKKFFLSKKEVTKKCYVSELKPEVLEEENEVFVEKDLTTAQPKECTWINTLMYSWGSDTPQEVLWGLNELVKNLKEKYPEENFIELVDFEDNEEAVEKLQEFINKKLGL